MYQNSIYNLLIIHDIVDSTYLFDVFSLLSSIAELGLLASSFSEGMDDLTDCAATVGCVEATEVGSSVLLGREDCCSASNFYRNKQWIQIALCADVHAVYMYIFFVSTKCANHRVAFLKAQIQ